MFIFKCFKNVYCYMMTSSQVRKNCKLVINILKLDALFKDYCVYKDEWLSEIRKSVSSVSGIHSGATLWNQLILLANTQCVKSWRDSWILYERENRKIRKAIFPMLWHGPLPKENVTVKGTWFDFGGRDAFLLPDKWTL